MMAATKGVKMPELINAISAGGDVATVAIALAIYRIDKRASRLEIIENLSRQN